MTFDLDLVLLKKNLKLLKITGISRIHKRAGEKMKKKVTKHWSSNTVHFVTPGKLSKFVARLLGGFKRRFSSFFISASHVDKTQNKYMKQGARY